MSATAKLSRGLVNLIAACEGDDEVEVLVELGPADVPTGGARAERIGAVRAAFEHELSHVERVIAEAGGRVTDVAWLAHSVRSRLPIKGLGRLAEDERVVAIDVATRLAPER